ncbi:MAG TPA: ImmA/IrrE family metallo-endopeptidase [Candidatus Dormibacteraeota bacterium]|nr:ImmA/IrrE family metallo-endopeptidase [Candidatus Dormibacteraeota bacterium]
METITVGGRRYTDPDIISLIRATGQLVDPRSAVVHQARQLNREYRSFANEAPPFERLKILASLRGLTITEMERQISSREKRDAVLVPTSGGKRAQIVYNPDRPPGRVAFSIAHEIAHTFFPNSISGARFRTICNPDSREGNELERLCDLAASELLMPLEEFRKVTGRHMGLHLVDQLSAIFGSSYESTVFRMATFYDGLAAAGLLRYRLNKGEQRALLISSRQRPLFDLPSPKLSESSSPKYRRQSFYTSESCGNEHLVPWNKSFDPSSLTYIAGRCTAIQQALEALPNQANLVGSFEAVRAPYQREDADTVYGDVLFLWWVSP